ncbi:hypothetical protein Tco_1505293 [Tanacetum coccineum]
MVAVGRPQKLLGDLEHSSLVMAVHCFHAGSRSANNSVCMSLISRLMSLMTRRASTIWSERLRLVSFDVAANSGMLHLNASLCNCAVLNSDECLALSYRSSTHAIAGSIGPPPTLSITVSCSAQLFNHSVDLSHRYMGAISGQLLYRLPKWNLSDIHIGAYAWQMQPLDGRGPAAQSSGIYHPSINRKASQQSGGDVELVGDGDGVVMAEVSLLLPLDGGIWKLGGRWLILDPMVCQVTLMWGNRLISRYDGVESAELSAPPHSSSSSSYLLVLSLIPWHHP